MYKYLLNSAKARFDLYTEAFILFEQSRSFPQVVKALESEVDDQMMLVVIVNKAMKDEWHILHQYAAKLFAEDYSRDRVIEALVRLDNDKEVIELIVDDLYTRYFDLSDDLQERERQRKKWVRFIQVGTILIAFISLITGYTDVNDYSLLITQLVLIFLVPIVYGILFPLEKSNSYKRHVQFEVFKKTISMTRLRKLFMGKRNNILNVYCTAGYPHLNSTRTVMSALQDNGVDIIELGMPYSDPLADGPVIQASGTKALENGMTIKKLFEQLQGFRNEIHIPVILMGYMNPVLQYGFEKFCADAAAVGVDGLILPDLPEFEFETEYGAIIKKHGLDFIFLVTPETSEERIKRLDELSSGFLYAVSSSATTGKDKDFSAVENYLQKLQQMKLKNPVMVGFGIKDRATFQSACKYANGAIIGTAFIQALDNTDTDSISTDTAAFIKTIL